MLRNAARSLRKRLAWWLLGRKPLRLTVTNYEGSTALSVQNDRNPDLRHIFYVQKWGAEGADAVIERLEGNEYHLVSETDR